MDEKMVLGEIPGRFENEEGEEIMPTVKERIAELNAEIEDYRNAILDAEGALDSAEKELDQILSEI